MSTVINTPSGNIGRALASLLLDAGEPVTVISRSADKVRDLTDRGARLVEGSTDDDAVLAQALTGATALYWVTPPPSRPGYIEWAVGAAEAAARAARQAGVRHVVVQSSVGAHTGRGTGPVGALLEVENAFTKLIPHVAILRAGFFMENFLRDAQSIAGGAIYSALPGDVPVPIVATRDIAARAASYLLSLGSWSGHHIAGVHGPRDLSQNQVVAQLAKSLGRSIQYVQVSVDAARQAMLGFGMPDWLAGLYAEMYQSVCDGRMASAEPRTPETTTPTTLHAFIETVLRPAITGMPAGTPAA